MSNLTLSTRLFCFFHGDVMQFLPVSRCCHKLDRFRQPLKKSLPFSTLKSAFKKNKQQEHLTGTKFCTCTYAVGPSHWYVLREVVLLRQEQTDLQSLDRTGAAPWSSRSRVKPRSLFWCAGIGLCQAACMQLHGENIHTIRWIKNKDWVILRNNYVLGNGHNKSCDSLQNPFLKETQRGATNDSITSAQMLKTQDFDVPDFDPDALHKGYRQSTILWLMVRFIKRQSCLNIL